MSQADDLIARYQVVCVIDILGQKEKLAGWAQLPTNGNQTPDLTKALKATVGTILAFRKQFIDYFHQTTQSTIPNLIAALPPYERSLYQRYQDCELSTQQFSDTFVFYAPIHNANGDASVIPLHRVLGACSYAMFTSMAAQVPLRGSITVGAAMELEERNVYGPALAEAHHLENTVAGYPRVVVSETVRKFLEESQIYSPEPAINTMMQNLSRRARSLLAQDFDGQWIVDYVGTGVYNLLGQGPTQSACVQKAYDFAVKEEKRFATEGDGKLAARYKQLREYLESRLSIWGIDSSSM